MEQFNPINNPEKPPGWETGGQASSPKSGSGAVVGAIIIILLLALGAVYLWSTRSSPNNNPPPLILGNDEAGSGTSDTEAGLPPQQASDSPEAIDADLQVIDLNQFDAQIDGDLQGFEESTQ